MKERGLLATLICLACSGCIKAVDGMWFTNEALEEYVWPQNEVPESSIELVELTGTALEGEEAPILYGVWVYPCTDATPQDCPDYPEYDPNHRETTILYLHGQDKHLVGHWDRVQILWRMGYTVFAVDYRGYGRSTGIPSEAAVYLDGRTALNHVLTRMMEPDDTELPRPELSKLVYYGRSLGSAIAIDLAAEFNPTALVTESAIAGAQGFTDDATGLGLSSSILMSSEFDTIGKIPFVLAPKLIMHGIEDDFVRFEFSQLLYEAATEPKRLVAVAGADHGNVPCPDRDSDTDNLEFPCFANESYVNELSLFLEEFTGR
jgi:fermentation-respiration switch protein FrsA (DUF1100 family)